MSALELINGEHYDVGSLAREVRRSPRTVRKALNRMSQELGRKVTLAELRSAIIDAGVHHRTRRGRSG